MKKLGAFSPTDKNTWNRNYKKLKIKQKNQKMKNSKN